MTTEHELRDCPICGQVAALWRRLGQFSIRRCGDCQHSFLGDDLGPHHVAVQYDDSYFCGGGDGYANYAASQQVVDHHVAQYVEMLGGESGRPGELMGVGAAAGFDLLPFREAGWHVAGIEPNASMCAWGRENFQLTMHQQTLEAFPVEHPVDRVIAIQVMAHFVDIRLAAAKFAELLRPGGLLLVETWNAQSWTARLLGRYWHEYSPPSVVHWFSPHSLSKLLEGFGFQKVAVGRPRKRIRGDHAAGLLRHKLGQLPGGRVWRQLPGMIPRRWVFPYPAEDLFYMLLRKNHP